jgi:hypothetical protein
MTDALFRDLEWLTGVAAAAGADPRRLERAADQIMEALMSVDPRRLKAVQKRSAVLKLDAQLKAAGTEDRRKAVMQRLKVSRPTYFRALSQARETLK